MRMFLIGATLATLGTVAAHAEPQKLDEGQLRGVAAGSHITTSNYSGVATGDIATAVTGFANSRTDDDFSFSKAGVAGFNETGTAAGTGSVGARGDNTLTSTTATVGMTPIMGTAVVTSVETSFSAGP
jgi:hypothetical protein